MSEGGEKSFAPTAKRKREAARKGDVLRSRELATAATILFGAAWFALAGPWLLGDLGGVLREGLTFDRADVAEFHPGRLLYLGLMTTIPPALTLFTILGVGAVFGVYGVFFAGALLVVAFVGVRELYLRDTLGENIEGLPD